MRRMGVMVPAPLPQPQDPGTSHPAESLILGIIDSMEKTSATNKEKRASWPVEVYRLGEEPSDDLSGSTTPEERLAMILELSEQAWLMSGRDMPDYDREETPGRVLRNQR